MAMENKNPFEDEKPNIVHFEKDESHYEYCRVQMREIERDYQRAFSVNLGICLLVCVLSVFRQFIEGFSLLSKPFEHFEGAGMVLAGGIFQIVIALIVIVFAYLAWSNFRVLNIFLMAWYLIIMIMGIVKGEYLSAMIGAVGSVNYFYAMRAMNRESSLSQIEGYPEFQETMTIDKSDIVVQTLLAHKGEHLTKSTLFTTDYSLRRKKKARAQHQKDEKVDNLAAELQKHIDNVRNTGEKTEPAAGEQPAEEPVTEPAAEEQPTEEPKAEPAAEEQPAEEPVTEPTDAKPTEEPKTEQTAGEKPTEEPKTEQTAEEKPAEEPKTEPAAEKPAEEPVTEPTAEEKPTEEPVTEPTAEETPAEEPKTEPAAEEQPAEEPKAEQTAAEKPKPAPKPAQPKPQQNQNHNKKKKKKHKR